MSMQARRFEACWQKFRDRLEGSLIQQSQQQPLTCAYARLLLADAAGDWGSEFDEGGRWLRDYTRDHPASGASILALLTTGMTFTEPETGRTMPELLRYAVPVAGAAVGYGVADAMKAGLLVKTVSTVAPAAVLYPAVKNLETGMQEKQRTGQVEAYLDQLEQYKTSVLSMLED